MHKRTRPFGGPCGPKSGRSAGGTQGERCKNLKARDNRQKGGTSSLLPIPASPVSTTVRLSCVSDAAISVYHFSSCERSTPRPNSPSRSTLCAANDRLALKSVPCREERLPIGLSPLFGDVVALPCAKGGCSQPSHHQEVHKTKLTTPTFTMAPTRGLARLREALSFSSLPPRPSIFWARFLAA